MAVLPTNYLDDILAASMGGKRRFRITHEDGSTEEVTLEDVSEYEQVGSPFGSGDVNKTNQAVNEKLDSADVVDPALATVLGFAADAKLTGDALSELNKNIATLNSKHIFNNYLGTNCTKTYTLLENRLLLLALSFHSNNNMKAINLYVLATTFDASDARIITLLQEDTSIVPSISGKELTISIPSGKWVNMGLIEL